MDFIVKEERYLSILIVDDLRDEFFFSIIRSIIGVCQVYFRFPSSIGGIIKTGKGWSRGVLVIDENTLVIKGKDRVIKIRMSDIIDYGRNILIPESNGRPVISIIILYNDEEIGLSITSSEKYLRFIEYYMGVLIDTYMGKMEYNDITNQLLFLLHTGFTREEEIVEMLGITEDELNIIYDNLLNERTVKLVEIKRVVSLTKPTLRYVNLIVKKGFG